VATTSRAFIAFPAAVVAFAALASCGGDRGNNGGSDAKSGTGASTAQASLLFPDNFKGVCSGASVSTATAYDPGAKAHKALYFATYKDDFSDRSSSLPGDWTVQFSPNSDAFRAIDLVTCARRTAAREVKICDGYKTDGNATQNKVRWHSATYELSVWEAKTGKKLAATTVEATDSDCPMFENFGNPSDIVDDYASPSDSAVADFLRPHIAAH
jgi:beta-xylosidase